MKKIPNPLPLKSIFDLLLMIKKNKRETMKVIVPRIVNHFTNVFVILNSKSFLRARAEPAKFKAKIAKAKYPLE
jgi:hypothetical protein